MDIRFTLASVEHVPVYYWPWVWWQLFWLRGGAEAAGRELIYEIDPRGKVHVLAVSDDTRDLRSWMEAQKRIYRDHWTPMHDPSGEAHLSAVHYWMGRFMERLMCREIWVDGLCVEEPLPPIQDSS